ncbi:MAG: amidohydrolase [Acidobacteria bacterium]|nr:amidohydrolase [Acidobacteriota bacterium]
MKGNPEDRLTILKNAQILTMNARQETWQGDILIEEGKITGIGKYDTSLSNVVQLDGRIVCPGFVQTHVHLCRTIFRGLPAWRRHGAGLRRTLTALEAALTTETAYLGAMIAGMELIACGTTSVMTMEPARHMDPVFEAMRTLGLRAVVARSMPEDSPGLPFPLREKPAAAIKDCLRLIKQWDGKEDGRLRFAVAPQAIPADGDSAFRLALELARDQNVPIVMHGAEFPEDVHRCMEKTGRRTIAALLSQGVPGNRLFLAHGVWVDDEEMALMAKEGVHVLHCPTSNLSLGAGVAMITEMVRDGIRVTLGSDGVPGSENLDIFGEMRLAYALQSQRKGTEALEPADILRMATADGARALGMDAVTGSLEIGKRADLVILKPNVFHAGFAANPANALVRACTPANVETVMINGDFVFRNGRFFGMNKEETVEKATRAVPELLRLAEQYGASNPGPVS